jgi:hypothetical protein
MTKHRKKKRSSESSSDDSYSSESSESDETIESYEEEYVDKRRGKKSSYTVYEKTRRKKYVGWNARCNCCGIFGWGCFSCYNICRRPCFTFAWLFLLIVINFLFFKLNLLDAFDYRRWYLFLENAFFKSYVETKEKTM